MIGVPGAKLSSSLAVTTTARGPRRLAAVTQSWPARAPTWGSVRLPGGVDRRGEGGEVLLAHEDRDPVAPGCTSWPQR